MRVVRVEESGGPEVLRIAAADEPEPSGTEVVVAVEVAGVGYGDTIVRSGRYPFPLPYVPGLEVGGRVVALGPDADAALLGRRVVATTVGMRGGYAERAVAASADVHVVDDDMPLDRAVPVLTAGAVAVGVLAAMRVGADDTVLVTAAAGRVGSLLVQLATAAGARVIGATHGAAKLAAATGFGASTTIDYGDPDWVGRVHEATDGRGADVVLDAIGGELGAQAIEAAADGRGRIGVYGFSSGAWTAIDTVEVARRGLSVVGALGIAFAKPAAEQWNDTEVALKAVAAGQLDPHVHARYTLEEAATAHTDLEQRRAIGAVLLLP